MHPTGFEPAIPASELLQTHDIDGMTTGIGIENITRINKRAAISVCLDDLAYIYVEYLNLEQIQ